MVTVFSISFNIFLLIQHSFMINQKPLQILKQTKVHSKKQSLHWQTLQF